ncbi:MAG: histidine phosphatase family protein [Planctomycetota bacterium]
MGDIAAMGPLLERLGRRKPLAIVGAPDRASLRVLIDLADRSGRPHRLEPALERQSAESPDAFKTRVLRVLDELSREFESGELVVVLHAQGIQAAAARALELQQSNVFSPEPGQAIALDWPHPEAREFKHALIGMAFDWDLSPPSTKVHKFPGGASVVPRSS